MNSRPFLAITGAYHTAAVPRNINAPKIIRRGLSSDLQAPVRIRYGAMIISGSTTPTRPFANVARPRAKQKTYQSRLEPVSDSLLSHKKKLRSANSIATVSDKSHVTPRAKPGHSPQVTSAAALKYPNRAERARRPKKNSSSAPKVETTATPNRAPNSFS